MKKLLLTLIVSLAFCGSIVAQGDHLNPNGYESHWADYTIDPFLQDYDVIISFMQIDGEILTVEGEDWDDVEIAAFVDGQLRGTAFMDYLIEDDYVIPYPFCEFYVWHTATNETVEFKLYNHASGVEYDDVSYNYDYVTGESHWEIYWAWEDFSDAFIFNFNTPAQEGYTLEIDPYTSVKDNYYIIASPVGAVGANSVAGLRTPDFDFYSFDQAAADGLEWINLRDDETFELQPGVGYLYANSTGTDLTFNGTAYTGEGEFGLTYDPNAEFAGWNLVGNPYAEDAYILCRDYYVVDGETFENIVQASDTPIAPMTGAFVIADGPDDYVTFATSLGGAPCGEVGEDDKLVLNLSKDRGLVDRAIVRFGEGRTLPKFQLHKNSTKLYFPVDGNDYAVVRSSYQGELPVNFKAESNGTYTLSVSAEAMNVNYLHLIDNLTGNDVDLLSTPSYSFEANTTDYASRFKLVYATGNTSDSFAFYSNGSFVINNEGIATLQVFDINGRILNSESINGCANIEVNAASGIYMLRLVNSDNVKVQKVVVR